MEAHERQSVVDQLDSSRDHLTGLIAGLSAEQWRFSPAEGRWSIGQCVEHVTRVEKRVFGLIGKKLQENNPEPAKATPEQKAKDAEVARLIPDRSIPRNAPEPALPTGAWSHGGELVADFEKTRQGTAEFARTSQGALRHYFIPHALFGELDCYQWLLALSLHGLRHARQIEEIKAAPGYPKN
ncbi:MAG TPA: DinB family protein [Bryobacteraceae bacterium]|jgi:hypothetical protein|nr:DinB family protein [Bryobacteraceae bacterium]